MRAAGGIALAVSMAGAGLLGAGCSSPARVARTSTVPPSSSSPTSSSSTSSTTATVAHCQPTGLSGSVVGQEGAAGTIELTVALKNTTTAGCALEGYPGLALVSSTGSELTTTVTRGGSYSFTDFAPSSVTLAAGATAYFNMGYSDVQSGATPCPTAASMWVTPPDDVDHLVVSESVMACNGVTVSPMFAAGSSQTQTTAP